MRDSDKQTEIAFLTRDVFSLLACFPLLSLLLGFLLLLNLILHAFLSLPVILLLEDSSGWINFKEFLLAIGITTGTYFFDRKLVLYLKSYLFLIIYIYALDSNMGFGRK